jgi:hypothetical protein
MELLFHIDARPPHRLFVRFDDGVEGEVDLAGMLRGPMFEPLHDPAYFALVVRSEYGAPLWPNGLDLAPDSLHQRVIGARVA